MTKHFFFFLQTSLLEEGEEENITKENLLVTAENVRMDGKKFFVEFIYQKLTRLTSFSNVGTILRDLRDMNESHILMAKISFSNSSPASISDDVPVDLVTIGGS